ATGIRIGTMLQNIANLGVGIILAFIYSWSLTLVMLAFVPFMIVAGFLQMYLLTGFTNNDKKALENAGKVTVESISNIRTVAQLTKEKYFDDEYCKLLDVCFKNSIKRANIFGLVFGFTDAIMFFAMAALFSFGAWRVEQGAMTFENVMLILNCILFGAMAVGQTSSMAPDYSKAINSSKKILVLFKRVPQIDNCSNAGKILENFDGQIGLNNLDFHYPNRQEVQVLKNFNLTIEPHKQIALVGSSGCGKSTIVQLLERFYDPTHGQIFPTLNLLRKDQSLLTSNQWTLLTNLFHCYKESQILPFSQRLIDTHDVLQSNYVIYQALVDDFLGSIYKTVEAYLCSNDDFRKLSSNDRSIMLRSAADNLCCMSGAFIMHHCHLYGLDAFLNVMNVKFGKSAMDIHIWARKFVDPDIVLVKLSISLFAFSENTCCYYSNSSNDLTNPIDILDIQNKYAEVTWKYLLFKYGYHNAVKRFLNITLWLASMNIIAVHAQSLPVHVNNIDSLVEQTELTLILDDMDQTIETK
ncbi:unnamed protein product, partial [Rotaria sp. Silwood1]